MSRKKKRVLCVVELGTDSTDAEILDQMRRMKAAREAGANNVICAVRGYDADDRELHQIPEVRGLLRRAWRLGFASHLDVFTDPELGEAGIRLPGLGAYEVWAVAYRPFERYAGGYRTKITRKVLNTFYAALESANEVCDRSIGPCGVDD